jgi:hypothetical protein
MWEPAPIYLRFSLPSFLLGVAYERVVNRFPQLRGLRAFLVGCFRKPENAGAPAQPDPAGSQPLRHKDEGRIYA